MLSVFSAAEKLLSGKEKPFAADIFLKWKEVVGNRYASIVSPYKVTTFAQRKVLILQASYGCGLLIQHESHEILRLVNRYLKQRYFFQVKVIQATR